MDGFGSCEGQDCGDCGSEVWGIGLCVVVVVVGVVVVVVGCFGTNHLEWGVGKWRKWKSISTSSFKTFNDTSTPHTSEPTLITKHITTNYLLEALGLIAFCRGLYPARTESTMWRNQTGWGGSNRFWVLQGWWTADITLHGRHVGRIAEEYMSLTRI